MHGQLTGLYILVYTMYISIYFITILNGLTFDTGLYTLVYTMYIFIYFTTILNGLTIDNYF